MERSSSPTPSTTFVQTDASTFKELVQRLTGPRTLFSSSSPRKSADIVTESSSCSSSMPSFPRNIGVVKKPAFKLRERRQCSRTSKLTNILKPSACSLLQAMEPGLRVSPRIVSPSSPSCRMANLVITTDHDDDQDCCTHVIKRVEQEEEQEAIRDRRFYLYSSSPRTTTLLKNNGDKPELLPLFPVTSCRSGKAED